MGAELGLSGTGSIILCAWSIVTNGYSHHCDRFVRLHAAFGPSRVRAVCVSAPGLDVDNAHPCIRKPPMRQDGPPPGEAVVQLYARLSIGRWENVHALGGGTATEGGCMRVPERGWAWYERFRAFLYRARRSPHRPARWQSAPRTAVPGRRRGGQSTAFIPHSLGRKGCSKISNRDGERLWLAAQTLTAVLTASGATAERCSLPAAPASTKSPPRAASAAAAGAE